MIINYLTDTDFEIIATVESYESKTQSGENKSIEKRLLTWQEMQQYPVLQKRVMKSGKILYRPRCEKGKNMIYKIDPILAGLNEKQVSRRKCIVVDTEDMIISNSFE